MSRTWYVRIVQSVVFAISFGAPLLAAYRTSSRPLIHFTVRNFAGVPGDVLMPSEALVADTFRDAGLEVMFSEGSLETDMDADGLPESHVHPAAAEINIHILSRSFLTTMDDAMGIAQPRQRIVYIFYNRIQKFVLDFESPSRLKSSFALLLSCIVSHEAGHVLMPNLGHRQHSLMQAKWNPSDLFTLEIRGARFSSDQEAAIRRSAAILARGR